MKGFSATSKLTGIRYFIKLILFKKKKKRLLMCGNKYIVNSVINPLGYFGYFIIYCPGGEYHVVFTYTSFYDFNPFFV